MDTIEKLTHHIKAVKFIEQRMLANFSNVYRVNDETKLRCLLRFVLRQQKNFGRDASLDKMEPLFKDLRDHDSLHCYTIVSESPPSSPSHVTRSQAKGFFRVDNPYTDSVAEWQLRVLNYWTELDSYPWLGRHFMVYATVQENHELVFTLLILSTTAFPLALRAPVIRHPETGSPSVRMVARVVGGPDKNGHLRLADNDYPRRASPTVSIYEDALTDYIKAAENYCRTLESYADGIVYTADTEVLEAYRSFIEANRWLLFLDESIEDSRDISCSNGLRMVRDRMNNASVTPRVWGASFFVFQNVIGLLHAALGFICSIY